MLGETAKAASLLGGIEVKFCARTGSDPSIAVSPVRRQRRGSDAHSGGQGAGDGVDRQHAFRQSQAGHRARRCRQGQGRPGGPARTLQAGLFFRGARPRCGCGLDDVPAVYIYARNVPAGSSVATASDANGAGFNVGYVGRTDNMGRQDAEHERLQALRGPRLRRRAHPAHRAGRRSARDIERDLIEAFSPVLNDLLRGYRARERLLTGRAGAVPPRAGHRSASAGRRPRSARRSSRCRRPCPAARRRGDGSIPAGRRPRACRRPSPRRGCARARR